MELDPFQMFGAWFEEARLTCQRDHTAMTLATATKDGIPSARVVLLKAFDSRGFSFYTNFDSRKGSELQGNPRAALVFWWSELRRQVRIEGTVERVDSEEADLYFASRPRGSQVGAWASPQSREIPSREMLEQEVAVLTEKFEGQEVPRPGFWGGFRVVPHTLEFWQDRPDRLHDRDVFQRHGSEWRRARLAP